MPGEAAAALADREVATTRTFNASPALVWRAWTDPQAITRWWGPAGFSTTTHSMDLRPGGAWRFDMHGPDGRNYPNRVIFEEVVESRRLVYRHDGADDVEDVSFHVTVTFEPRDGGTLLTMRMVFATTAERDRVIREYGADLGAVQTVTRLAEHLGERPAGAHSPLAVALPSDREILIARDFDAPREMVWKALTTPNLLKRWLLGPPGWELVVCEIDLRIGGAFRYEWRKDDGTEMGMGGVYQEIDPPQRLVNTEVFDEAWYAGEALVTQRLTEHAGRTTLALSILYDSKEIRDNVLKSGMTRGVTFCYDLLAQLLASH